MESRRLCPVMGQEMTSRDVNMLILSDDHATRLPIPNAVSRATPSEVIINAPSSEVLKNAASSDLLIQR